MLVSIFLCECNLTLWGKPRIYLGPHFTNIFIHKISMYYIFENKIADKTLCTDLYLDVPWSGLIFVCLQLLVFLYMYIVSWMNLECTDVWLCNSHLIMIYLNFESRPTCKGYNKCHTLGRKGSLADVVFMETLKL